MISSFYVLPIPLSSPLQPASALCFSLLSSLRHNISCRRCDAHTLSPSPSLLSHTYAHKDTHRAPRRGSSRFGLVPPLCFCGMDLSTTMCCAWPAHSVVAVLFLYRLPSLYMNSDLVAGLTQTVHLSSQYKYNFL